MCSSSVDVFEDIYRVSHILMDSISTYTVCIVSTASVQCLSLSFSPVAQPGAPHVSSFRDLPGREPFRDLSL